MAELVRWADESGKPNGDRLREYTESRLPQLKQGLFAEVPVYEDFETATLSFGLDKMREELGADHPVIKKVYGQESPAEIAARFFPEAERTAPGRGGHIMHASTI